MPSDLEAIRSSRESLEEKWIMAVEFSEHQLGEDDHSRLSKVQDAQELIYIIEEMRRQLEDNRTSQYNLGLYIQSISYVDAAFKVALGASKSRSTLAYWGLMHLMLELAARSEVELSQLTRMWVGFANDLHRFEAYSSFIEEEANLGEALFGVLLDFFHLTVSAVKAIKLIPTRIGLDALNSEAQWIQLAEDFKSRSNNLLQTVDFIKRSSEDLKIAQERKDTYEKFDLLTRQLAMDGDNDGSSIAKSSTQEESDTAPHCYYVPFRPNENFFGRDELLREIESKLEPKDDTLRLLSIWGTGGVGKTQIALEFANRQRRKGVKYILWISSEHHSESAKAFTDIAGLLKLKGATTSKGHEQNKLLVLHFLQETTDSWLLIYDNIEKKGLLEGSLPSCGSGSILITCRSENLASSVAGQQTEIEVLTDHEGSILMLKGLGITNPSDEERGLTEEFARELGGLSLAIDLMSRHMRTRKKSVAQFLPYYRDNRRRLHRNPKKGIINPYYSRDLESVWSIAFGELDEMARKVFRVLCMLAPDRIPTTILSHKALISSDLESLGDKVLDEEDLEEIIMNLVDLSLVKTTSTTLSVHRLVQLAFREHEKDGQVETFTSVCRILHDMFPRQEKGFALFNHWMICETLVEHVQILCERYNELAQTDQSIYLEDFSYLLSDCGRYLCEIGQYNAAKSVVATGFAHCGDRDTIPVSNLYTDMGAILNEQGHDKEALLSFSQALAIREKLLPSDDSEVANALSNCAIAQLGTGTNADVALAWLLRALAIDESKQDEIKLKVLHLRHFNLCFAYKALGKWDMFTKHLTKATEYVLAEFGNNSRYLVISNNHLSDLRRREGNLTDAYNLCKQAKEIAEKEVATSAWVSASVYKMGHIRLLQKRPKDALELLKKALKITRLNEREKDDQGDRARVLDKLARAYAMVGEPDASSKARSEADAIYARLTASGVYDPIGDKDEKWEFLVCIKFR